VAEADSTTPEKVLKKCNVAIEQAVEVYRIQSTYAGYLDIFAHSVCYAIAIFCVYFTQLYFDPEVAKDTYAYYFPEASSTIVNFRNLCLRFLMEISILTIGQAWVCSTFAYLEY